MTYRSKINLTAAKQATTKATEDIKQALNTAKTTAIKVDLNDQAKKAVEERNGALVTSLTNAIGEQQGAWVQMFQSQKSEVEKMCKDNNGVYCSESLFNFLLSGWVFLASLFVAAEATWICLKSGLFR